MRSVVCFLLGDSPLKMEQIECSEMSAYINQTPGNHPKENKQHSEHGESLKSRNYEESFFKYKTLNGKGEMLADIASM